MRVLAAREGRWRYALGWPSQCCGDPKPGRVQLLQVGWPLCCVGWRMHRAVRRAPDLGIAAGDDEPGDDERRPQRAMEPLPEPVNAPSISTHCNPEQISARCYMHIAQPGGRVDQGLEKRSGEERSGEEAGGERESAATQMGVPRKCVCEF